MRNKPIRSIELKDLGFHYATGGAILKDVSVALPVGGITHVTGPLGHGQSTLLKILALLLDPTHGQIVMNGSAVSDMSFEEFLPWRLEVGYTFESGGLLSNRTLEDNLLLPHLYHNIADMEALRASVFAVAKRFRFEGLLDRRPALVSGGLRKLVTILRPMLLRPSFLIMDDPFSGLDPETARELEKQIRELRERSEIGTIYFTSRDETWPSRLGAGSLWVENGKVELESRKKAV